MLVCCLGQTLAQQIQQVSYDLEEQKLKAEENLKKENFAEAAHLYKNILLQVEKKQKEEKAYYEAQMEIYRKEANEKNFQVNLAIYGFLLAGLAILLVVYLIIKNIRINDILKEKQQTIEEQNGKLQAQTEELRQQQEEILAQRDDIIAKNANLLQKSKLINDSLRVAQLIQKATLPQIPTNQDFIKDYFIIFKPLQVVSGDSYWFEVINSSTSMVALIDCTGHGIPAAYTSLIVNMLLKNIVLLEKHTEPSEILQKLNEDFKKIFRASDEEAKLNVGADIALCKIEKILGKEYKVTFAGARRNLLYTINENKEIHVLKGSRQFVGALEDHYGSFNNKVVELPENSRIFMFSDGFTDQNNSERKKMGENGLINILKETNHLPMKEQGSLIEAALSTHQGSHQQRDDMLMIGIKL
jgi:serine phosphatase RsbU (regulator of sigma subunit)